MLSKKVINKMKEVEDYSENNVEENLKICQRLKLDVSSDICQYFSHIYQMPDMMGKNSYNLYNLVWFEKESAYMENRKNLLNYLELPTNFYALDSFEGEGGYFYNSVDGSVIYLELGNNLAEFHKGNIVESFKDFNSFLEWFYEVD